MERWKLALPGRAAISEPANSRGGRRNQELVRSTDRHSGRALPELIGIRDRSLISFQVCGLSQFI